MRTKNTNRFLIIWLCGLMLFIFNLKSVYAVDPLVYPAANCIDFYSGTINKSQIFGTIRNGDFNNYRIVVCPTSFDHAGTIDTGFVRIEDRNFTRNFSCSLVTAYLNSAGDMSYTSQRRASTGTGVQTLTFSRMSAINTQAHVIVRCLIPPFQIDNGTSTFSTYSVDP